MNVKAMEDPFIKHREKEAWKSIDLIRLRMQ